VITARQIGQKTINFRITHSRKLWVDTAESTRAQ